MDERASSTLTSDTSDNENTCPWSCNIYDSLSDLDDFDWFPKEKHGCLDPGQEILHSAVTKFRVEEVRRLLDEGADINQKDCRGWSPLHHALTSECEVQQTFPQDLENKLRIEKLQVARQILKIIMDSKPNVNQQDSVGRSPLHIAALSGNIDYVIALLERGANAEQTDEDGRTPLHCAFLNRDNEPDTVARILLDEDVDVNVLDSRGATPIQYLYDRGSCEILVLLLFHPDANLKIEQILLTNQHFCSEYPEETLCINCPILTQHLHQNIALGLRIDSDVLKQLKQESDYHSEEDRDRDLLKFSEEVKMMKRCYLFESVSLFDIFLNDNFMYRSNRELAQNLKSLDYDRFPEFGSRLDAKLMRDKVRYEYHWRAREALLRLREASPNNFLQLLPNELIDKILHHHRIIELKNLLLCCKELNKKR